MFRITTWGVPFILQLLTFSYVTRNAAEAYVCYDCSSILGQCNDGRRGVKTVNLYVCQGGQCAKTQTFNAEGKCVCLYMREKMDR